MVVLVSEEAEESCDFLLGPGEASVLLSPPRWKGELGIDTGDEGVEELDPARSMVGSARKLVGVFDPDDPFFFFLFFSFSFSLLLPSLLWLRPLPSRLLFLRLVVITLLSALWMTMGLLSMLS
jgi:hypothetical protein